MKKKTRKVVQFTDLKQAEYYNKLSANFEENNGAGSESMKLFSIVSVEEDDADLGRYNAAIIDRSAPSNLLILFNDSRGMKYTHIKDAQLEPNVLMALAQSQPDKILMSLYAKYDKANKVIYLYEYANDRKTKRNLINKGV